MGSSGLWTLVLGVIFFIGSSSSEKAPYSTFARDATSAPPVLHHDYIIIGGGTAGCALAATLSENSNVLLLERGGLPYGNPSVEDIRGFGPTLADVSPSSASQLFISTDGVFNHRARVLGGGSALNAGFYTRASADYVKQVGWDPKLVNESYEWTEKKVAFEPAMLQWQSAVRDGLLEAGVSPYNGFTYEHIPGTKVGGSIFDRNGHRHTAADLLEYADPARIAVYLNATVQKILFRTEGGQAKPRAYGVLFRDRKGRSHVAYLNTGPKNEIILSAGAIGSPQILMLSGVGPFEQLEAHNIKVVLAQPEVGQGMSDNPMNILLVPSARPVEVSLIQVVGITQVGSFIEAASGSLIIPWAHKLATQFSLLQNQTIKPLAFEAQLNGTFPGGILLEKIIGPLSSGHLELISTDPTDNPKVTFNYFADPTDLHRCVQGMQTLLKVAGSKPISEFFYPLSSVQSLIDLTLTIPVNLRPKHVDATYSLEKYCLDTVMTIWHYHGGCQVDRVVDRDYRVIGLDGLRVIDGSTFINSPGTNPQATVMMLGRYMGQKILRER